MSITASLEVLLTYNMKKYLLTLILLLPTLAFAAPTSTVSSTAYETSHIIKTGPGKLMLLMGYNSKGSAQFIQLFDGTAAPAAEVSTATFTGLTAVGLGNKYFLINAPAGAFYVWFNLDAGGVDPAPGGTGIEVAVTTGDSATTIATAIKTAVDAEAAFVSTNVGAVVTITNAAVGSVTDIDAGDSGASVAVTTQGTSNAPAAVFTVPATSNFSLAIPGEGLPFSTGIFVTNSSTGPTRTVGSADCYFTAVIQ